MIPGTRGTPLPNRIMLQIRTFPFTVTFYNKDYIYHLTFRKHHHHALSKIPPVTSALSGSK